MTDEATQPPGTALRYAINLLAVLTPLMRAGVEVRDLIEAGLEKLTELEADGRDPDASEWEELGEWIGTLRSELTGDANGHDDT